ncbi:MAG: hypothetical protein V1788_02655 [Nanoarchaeota archaeon]
MRQITIKFSNRVMYTFILFGVLILLSIGFAVYAYGGSSPSVVGHSVGEMDWSGTVPVLNVNSIKLGSATAVTSWPAGATGATGPQGPAGATGATGATGPAGVPPSGGLYGKCLSFEPDYGTVQCRDVLSPAYCTSSWPKLCACPSGYTKVETGAENVDFYHYFSCYKN